MNEIQFKYILGGDLELDIVADITPAFAGTHIDPPYEAEMEITQVLLPDGKTFEIDDVYIKVRNKHIELYSLIEEAGWDAAAENHDQEPD